MVNKQNLYGNIRVESGGLKFDSIAEKKRYWFLKEKEAKGLLKGLETQKRYPFVINDVRVSEYRADFVYRRDGKTIIEDVKSPVLARSNLFKIKAKLMQALHQVEIILVHPEDVVTQW